MASATVFDEGNVLWFQCIFIDEMTQEPLNPTNVAFGYRLNSGPTNAYIYGLSAMTNPQTGTFLIPIFTLGYPGIWIWQWQSTGTGEAQVNGAITITQKQMALL
jgi:predicted secreted protein